MTPPEPGNEVRVKDLDRPDVLVKAAETPRSYEVKTPISTVRRNRVYLTPMPEQRENQPVPAEDKITAPVQADQPKQAAPTTPFLANRPKRLLKPSLKVQENLGLIWHFSDGLDSLPCYVVEALTVRQDVSLLKRGDVVLVYMKC